MTAYCDGSSQGEGLTFDSFGSGAVGVRLGRPLSQCVRVFFSPIVYCTASAPSCPPCPMKHCELSLNLGGRIAGVCCCNLITSRVFRSENVKGESRVQAAHSGTGGTPSAACRPLGTIGESPESWESSREGPWLQEILCFALLLLSQLSGDSPIPRPGDEKAPSKTLNEGSEISALIFQQYAHDLHAVKY